MMESPIFKEISTDLPLAEQVQELRARLELAEKTIQTLLKADTPELLALVQDNPQLFRTTWESLQKADDRYHRLVNRMSAVVFELDIDGRLLFVSDALWKITGYSPSEINEENWLTALFPGKLREKVLALLKRMYRGDITNQTVELRVRDGRAIFLELSSANRYSPDERLESMICIGVDITSRKVQEEEGQRQMLELAEAEEGLRLQNEKLLNAQWRVIEERQRYQELFEFAPDGYLVTDISGKILEANRAAANLFHVSQTQLVGLSLISLVADSDHSTFLKQLSQLLQVDPFSSFELQIHPRQGESFPAMINTALIGGLQDQRPESFNTPTGVRWIIRDISGWKLNEAALRLSEERFRTLADTTSAAIFILDGMDIIYANHGARFLTGFSTEELFGMDFLTLVAPAYRSILQQYGLANPWVESLPVRYELKIINRARDERWVDITAGPIDYNGRPMRVLTAFDITERDLAEQALRKAKTELEQRVVERTSELRTSNERLQYELNQRKRLLEQLESERSRLNAIIENAPEGIVVVDEACRVIITNPVADHLYNRPVPYGQELETHRTMQLCYPDGTPYEPRDLPVSKAALDGETQDNVELTIIWPDGQRRELLVNAAPIYDSNGKLTGGIGVFQDITQRNQIAEELRQARDLLEQRVAQRTQELLRSNQELRDQQKLLQVVLETLPVGVWLADKEGILYKGNALSREIWGGERRVGPTEYGEYKGWWYETGQPISPEEWSLNRAIRYGESSKDEVIRIESFDGSGKVILNSAVPIYTEENTIGGAVIVNQDITDRILKEQALQQTKELLEKVFFSVDTHIAYLDRNFNFVKVNRAYALAGGQPEDYYIGKNHFELYPYAENQRIFQRVIDTGEPFLAYEKAFEYAGHPEWGVSYWDWSLQPVKDPDGSVSGLVLSLVNQTEKVKARQALERSQQNYKGLVNSVDGVVWEADPATYNFSFVSKQAERILGYSIDQWLTEPDFWKNHIHRDDLFWVTAFSEQALATLQDFEYEYRMIAADGELVWMKDFVTVISEAGKPVSLRGIMVDITTRIQAEEQLRQAHDQLEQRVKERTAELGYANQSLQNEITHRQKIEIDLRLALEASKQRESEISALLKGARAILEERDYHKASTLIFELCKQLLGADAGYLGLLVDEDGIKKNEVVVMEVGEFGCELDPLSEMPMNGLRKLIYENKETSFDNDFPNSSWAQILPKGHSPLENILFAPMVIGGEVVGFLGYANKPGGFNENDARMATAFGELAAIGLINSQADQALREARDELEVRVQIRTQELEARNKELRQEISERKRAERELRLQTTAVEAAGNAIIITDADGIIQWANPAFTRLTGFNVDEVVGTTPSFLNSRQQTSAFYRNLWATILSGKVWRGEIINRRKDKSYYMEEQTIAPVMDEKGKITHFIAVKQDITERKQAENLVQRNAVRASVLAEVSKALGEAGPNDEAVLEAIGESTSRLIGDLCLIRLVNEDGSCLEPVSCSHLDPDINAFAWSILAAGPQPTHEGLAGRVFTSGEPLLIPAVSPVEIPSIVRPEYLSYYEKYGLHSILVVPLVYQGRTHGTLTLTRDINPEPYNKDDLDVLINIAERATLAIMNARLFRDLAKSLREEQNMRNQLVQAEKHTATGRMMASVAHELNNPIQTIKNCLYLAQQDLPLDSAIHEFLGMATSETQRVSKLVMQLREIYRPNQTGELKQVDLHKLIGEVHALLSPHLSHQNVEWELDIPKRVLDTRGVPDQLKQVFLNISLNAIEIMQPEGGLLSVQVTIDPNEQQIGIAFMDSGPGIPDNHIPRIFEPFFTTKDTGTGLGLSICYDIIRRHDGQITVENRPEGGASFTVWLPLCNGS